MSSRPVVPALRPGEYDAELRLLDHQVVSSEKEMLGKVDDMTLVEDGTGLRVGQLLVGPEALGSGLPGKVGSWPLAIWRRLRPDTDPSPITIPLGDVLDVGSALTVRPECATRLQGELGLELWLRRFVVAKIPGASLDPEKESYTLQDERSGIQKLLQVGGLSPPRISRLIGARVLSSRSGVSGAGVPGAALLGFVVDVRLATRHGHISSGLDVSGILVSPRRLGATLGYLQDPRQGPAVLGALFRRYHGGCRFVPWRDVEAVDWAGRSVRVRATGGPVTGA